MGRGVYGLVTNGTSVGIYGETTSTTAGTVAVLGYASGASGQVYGMEGLASSLNGVGVIGVASNTGGSNVGVYGLTNSPQGVAGYFRNSSNGDIVQGWNGPGTDLKFKVAGDGNVTADGAFAGGGADFAESVDVAGEKRNYEPGDVMVVDESSNRRFALSQKPYSKSVAGVYSTKPGMLGTLHSMDSERRKEEIPMAIVGIVPTKASSENGPIRRGDLLVTSSTRGYAMKGTKRKLMTGAIVGKALEPLNSGTGVIEVLVTLQ
jgi:hypothetical protein